MMEDFNSGFEKFTGDDELEEIDPDLIDDLEEENLDDDFGMNDAEEEDEDPDSIVPGDPLDDEYLI